MATSNPTTAVATSLLINVTFLWIISVLFIPLDGLANPAIFIFVFVALFQPGLTRLPILAAAVTSTSSFLIVVSGFLIFGKRTQLFQLTRQGLPYLLGAGICISVSMVAIYYALDLGQVVVVIPLSSTGPLFALTLSAILLRDSERVTAKILAGATLIVGGAILITLWKP